MAKVDAGPKYPKGTGDKRPFRLWDAQAKKHMPHKSFAIKENAHMSALYECRWQEVGRCIEVYDRRNGKLLGQYTRKVNRIDFLEG